MAQPFAVELDAVHRLALDATLAPEWLRRLGKVEAASAARRSGAHDSGADVQDGGRRDGRRIPQPQRRR